MKMIPVKHIILSVLFFISVFGFGQGSISGKLFYQEGYNQIPVWVLVYKSDSLVNGALPDTNGYFSITGVDTGHYEVLIRFTGNQCIDSFDLVSDSLITIDNVLYRVTIVCMGHPIIPSPYFPYFGINEYWYLNKEFEKHVHSNDIFKSLEALSSEFQISR